MICPYCETVLTEDNYARYVSVRENDVFVCLDCWFDLQEIESMCGCQRIAGDAFDADTCELHQAA